MPTTPRHLESHICSLCFEPFTGWGNNPQPLLDSVTARCCDRCNTFKVIPARIDAIRASHSHLAGS